MRHWILLALLVFSIGCGNEEVRKAPPAVKRVPSAGASDFERDVLQWPTPVVVDFWAPWCGPCKLMEPALASLGKDYKVVKINVDKHPDLSAQYEVDAIPLTLVFNEGKVVARHRGVTPEATIRADLERLKK